MQTVNPWSQPKAHVTVRHKRERSGVRKLGYGLFRFAMYGFFGTALEIFFYNLVKVSRGVPVLEYFFRFDWRVDERLNLAAVWGAPLRSLFGQCSLWMFVVYAVASFGIESLYRRMFGMHVITRAVAYGTLILCWECLSGWLLFWLTGYKIWFYADAGALFEMTSLYILPVWIVTGLFVEYLYRQLMDPDLVSAIETATPEPQFKPS